MHGALTALLAEGAAARDEGTRPGARLAKLIYFIRAFRPGRLNWAAEKTTSPGKVGILPPCLLRLVAWGFCAFSETCSISALDCCVSARSHSSALCTAAAKPSDTGHERSGLGPCLLLLTWHRHTRLFDGQRLVGHDLEGSSRSTSGEIDPAEGAGDRVGWLTRSCQRSRQPALSAGCQTDHHVSGDQLADDGRLARHGWAPPTGADPAEGRRWQRPGGSARARPATSTRPRWTAWWTRSRPPWGPSPPACGRACWCAGRPSSRA